MTDLETNSEQEERVVTTYPNHKVVSASLKIEDYLILMQYCKRVGKAPGTVIREATLGLLARERKQTK